MKKEKKPVCDFPILFNPFDTLGTEADCVNRETVHSVFEKYKKLGVDCYEITTVRQSFTLTKGMSPQKYQRELVQSISGELLYN